MAFVCRFAELHVTYACIFQDLLYSFLVLVAHLDNDIVEAGRVEAIVIKDMSRLGRDYLKVGQVMEVLRQRGVRLIAINDGVDSLKGDDDFTPFRNIMNEFYARDTSRKIRSVFKSKGMSGKHLTGTVIYGYLWDEKRKHWLVDEEAAEVVRRIFSLTLEGIVTEDSRSADYFMKAVDAACVYEIGRASCRERV